MSMVRQFGCNVMSGILRGGLCRLIESYRMGKGLCREGVKGREEGERSFATIFVHMTCSFFFFCF